MILIISEHNDVSTTDVIKWIIHLKKEFIRINSNDTISIKDIEIGNNFTLLINNEIEIFYSQITSVWYRRGFLNIDILQKTYDSNCYEFYEELDNACKKQNHLIVQDLLTFLFYKLDKLKHINSFFTADINKLWVLEKAISVGLKIPKTFITSSKQSLSNFINNEHFVITKHINNGLPLKNKDLVIYNYTAILETDLLNKLSDEFFPSLFQNEIQKEYELRIFFLDGLFHTMAIFSQIDVQTKVDFRNYNFDKPNRNVPFILPIKIAKKLKKLMNLCKLNCGSIDMILDTKKEYYFLEINPIGQFGMVSNPCNYFIEEVIAKYL